jgi:hypothetical protein
MILENITNRFYVYNIYVQTINKKGLRNSTLNYYNDKIASKKTIIKRVKKIKIKS